MDNQLKKAASNGDVTILDGIRKGELIISDSQFLSFDMEGYNFIHLALHYKQEAFVREVFGVLKPDVLVELLFHRNKLGSNSLHEASCYGCLDTVKLLVEFYRSWSQNGGDSSDAKAPWLVINNAGRAPLHDALVEGYDEIACFLFSLNPEFLFDKVDNLERSPLFIAVEKCDKFVELILGKEFPATEAFFSGWNGRTVLHQVVICKKAEEWRESIVKKLLHKLDGKQEIIWKKDFQRWTALHYAADSGDDKIVELLLKNPTASCFKMFDQDSASPVRLALEHGHNLCAAIISKSFPMIMNCRGEKNTTWLHHIKLQSRQEYNQILEMRETKNILNHKDSDGRTPLHQAIADGNFVLVELLFNMDGCGKEIKDNDGKTPIRLLTEKSKKSPECAKLCQQLGVVVWPYLAHGTDLMEVRSAVMVVAALLATITFQAAFTVPEVIYKSTVWFVIFFLSDTVAMCSSLLVMFWLIWAMIEDDPEKSRKLADRSFFVLELSFYATLVVFATAAFAIALHKSLFLAIGITCLCLLVPLLSSKTIISTLFKARKIPVVTQSLLSCSTGATSDNSNQESGSGNGTRHENV